jgi:GT2 family glycosyltransferase
MAVCARNKEQPSCIESTVITMNSRMKIAVIIPTLGRKELILHILALLEAQTRAPDIVVISAPDESHVEPYTARKFSLSTVFGPKGLCKQRNRAMDVVVGQYDIITFFDDDFLPAENYLERVEEAFSLNSDWAVAMGHAVYDGARGPGYGFSEGFALLEQAKETYIYGRPENVLVTEFVGAYGCNMSIRAKLIDDRRFDERLPLYGWQEDIDFTSQLRLNGRVVNLSTLYGVHLGIKKGRVSGLKFGYSQIINPIYLVKKGTMPASFALKLAGRNLLANIAKSIWPETYVDRRGRLKGNLLAILHLVKGRIDPEYILEL